jgi:hypothetical protein
MENITVIKPTVGFKVLAEGKKTESIVTPEL